MQSKETGAGTKSSIGQNNQSNDDGWLEKFRELAELKKREGGVQCPPRAEGNYDLTRWVKKQREQFLYMKKGKVSSMTKERVEMLKRIGFSWNIKETSDRMAWNDHYVNLVRFKTINGHCKVPQRYPENPGLGRWVMTQRLQYKYMKQGKPTMMSQERFQALDKLGFTWDMIGTNGIAWMRRYEELKDFHAREGHCRVPRTYFDNPRLGSWVNFQRSQYKYMQQGKPSQMKQERVDLLNKIGFTWNVIGADGDKWMEKYEALKEFQSQEGHCRVPTKFKDDPSLGLWVVTQRQNYKFMKEGKPTMMTERRAQLLQDIGFTWNVKGSNKLP